MTILDWKPILHPIQVVSTLFGMSMNSLLILLILYRSPQNLGVYKYLMVYISVFELFFGILELMAVPDLWTRGSVFIVLTDPGSTILPKIVLQATTLLYCGSFALSLAIFGVQFVYRYQVFQGNSSWLENRLGNILFWMGTPILIAGIWAATCGFFLGRNVYVDDLLRNDILPYCQNVSVDDIGVVCVYFFPKIENDKDVINWSSFIGMTITTIVLLTTESVMLFSGIKCYLAIKKLMGHTNPSQSKNFRQIQWQLFCALVSQTFIPIIFMQFPISILYISIFANSSTDFFGILQSLTISFYLATDALPTIFIIKNFREAVFDFFHNLKSLICFCSSESPTSGATTASNTVQIAISFL